MTATAMTPAMTATMTPATMTATMTTITMPTMHMNMHLWMPIAHCAICSFIQSLYIFTFLLRVVGLREPGLYTCASCLATSMAYLQEHATTLLKTFQERAEVISGHLRRLQFMDRAIFRILGPNRDVYFEAQREEMQNIKLQLSTLDDRFEYYCAHLKEYHNRPADFFNVIAQWPTFVFSFHFAFMIGLREITRSVWQKRAYDDQFLAYFERRYHYFHRS